MGRKKRASTSLRYSPAELSLFEDLASFLVSLVVAGKLDGDITTPPTVHSATTTTREPPQPESGEGAVR
jgi:hypothetical protein